MITMQTNVDTSGVTGKEIIDFMLNCTDQDYQKWWQGTHLAFHTLERYPNNLGNLVYFDEYVGKRRLRFKSVVTEIIPGKKLVWQMKMLFKLPGWLILEFKDIDGDTKIIHTLVAGYGGIGKILDPLIRKYLSKHLEAELAEHAQFEFKKLVKILLEKEVKETPPA